MTAVDAISAVTFGAFWLLLLVGLTSTLARVAYYRRNRFKRPRLLIRDANMLGGFSWSFGLILLVRVVRAAGIDTSGLATDWRWAFLSSVGAVWAVACYAYYELAVIERGRDELRDDTYLNPERPE